LWVLAEACRQAREWQDKYRLASPSVSVNLSARQFQQPGLVADVARALSDSGLDPQSLRLEITESVIMEDADATIATLRQLKALGVEIAIDDFGTGYSSLAYLRKFPVDFLKIDRSFISGLGRSNEDTTIAQAVIGLGHALSLTVVAEGIETIGQLVHLCSLDCELGQGDHFAKPLPAPDAETLLAGERLSLQPVLSLPLHLAPTVA
jgi:EAL domain-containing protein (putative c-di-GMP-specific phosphodiesterase class I)